jgi:hypothetical protein
MTVLVETFDVTGMIGDGNHCGEVRERRNLKGGIHSMRDV